MVAITSIGTATGSTVGSIAVTVPAGGVPLGALIVVCVADSSVSVVGGSVVDTALNTYTRITGADNNNLTTNGFGAIFYTLATTSLVQNNTITYSLALTANAAVTAFYAQTIQAFSTVDAAVTNTATGSSTAPSVAGLGAPAGSGEFWVGAVSNTGPSSETFTQDSSNAAWATPSTRVGIAVTGPTIAGGAITSGLTSALTYAPTLGTSHPWAAIIVAFKVAQPAFSLPLQLRPVLAM